MKKQHLYLPAVLTCLFAAFTLGFFLGRNLNHETLQISVISTSAGHNTPIETVSSVETESVPVTFPVDINSAGLEQICALPGIGQALAQRILDYRDLNGPFDRPEELMNVDGIGAGKLEALLNYVTTGG